MNNLKSIVDMVLQDAIESGEESEMPQGDTYNHGHNPNTRVGSKTSRNLPPIKFDLELLERPDGSLYWVE